MALSGWDNLSREKNLPLRYVGGWSHSVPSGVSCRLHSHQDIEIVYHPTGRGCTRLGDGEKIGFAENSFIIYAPQLEHDQVMDKEGEDLCIHLRLPSGCPRLKGCLHASGNNRLLHQEAVFLTTGHVSPGPEEQTILNLRATALLLSLVQAARPKPSLSSQSGGNHVKAAEIFILKQFASIRTMEEVAGHVGISQDHLRHLFKKTVGISLIAFLNQTRLERAKSLLAHSRLSMKEISSLCGFHDEYYFSAVFTRNLKMPPGSYRKIQTGQAH